MVSFSGTPSTQQARDTRPHWYPTVRLWSQDRPCSLAAFPSRQQSQHIYRIYITQQGREKRENKTKNTALTWLLQSIRKQETSLPTKNIQWLTEDVDCWNIVAEQHGLLHWQILKASSLSLRQAEGEVVCEEPADWQAEGKQNISKEDKLTAVSWRHPLWNKGGGESIIKTGR